MEKDNKEKENKEKENDNNTSLFDQEDTLEIHQCYYFDINGNNGKKIEGAIHISICLNNIIMIQKENNENKIKEEKDQNCYPIHDNKSVLFNITLFDNNNNNIYPYLSIDNAENGYKNLTMSKSTKM